MKLPSLLTLTVALISQSWAASVSDVVKLTVPPTWRLAPPGQTSPFPTDKYVPTDGRNASLMVSLLPNELIKVSDEASLRELYQRLWSSTTGPTAGTPAVNELKLASGSGLYATSEDPSLIGKPPKRGDFKFATPIAIFLPPDILVQVTLFTDSANGPDFTEGLQIIRSIQAVGHPTPLPPDTLAAIAKGPILLRGPDSVLLIPRGSFKPMPTTDKDRNYFIFTDEKGVNLSTWIDEASRYAGFTSFWAKEKATLEQKGGFTVRDEQIKLIGSWSTVLYRIDTMGATQLNLRGCRTTGKTWVDLHLSLMEKLGTYNDLEAVVKGLILKRD